MSNDFGKKSQVVWDNKRMGRIYFSSKREADALSKLTIFELNSKGYLKNMDAGEIGVFGVDSFSPNNNRLSTIISQVTVSYWKINENGFRRSEEVTIDLAKTECVFGGNRFWFICPSYNCGKRIGVLYLSNGRFACRNCHNLSYRSRNENKRYAMIFRLDILDRKIDQLERRIKRRYYSGKPTRMQKKINRISFLLDNMPQLRVSPVRS